MHSLLCGLFRRSGRVPFPGVLRSTKITPAGTSSPCRTSLSVHIASDRDVAVVGQVGIEGMDASKGRLDRRSGIRTGCKPNDRWRGKPARLTACIERTQDIDRPRRVSDINSGCTRRRIEVQSRMSPGCLCRRPAGRQFAAAPNPARPYDRGHPAGALHIQNAAVCGHPSVTHAGPPAGHDTSTLPCSTDGSGLHGDRSLG